MDLGIRPTHLALSPDASYLAMAGVRTEVTQPIWRTQRSAVILALFKL